MFNKEDYEKRINWFTNDRFGMFIHWGLYAIPARGEWVRSVEQISKEDYQVFFDEFNPTDYNPKEWARICKKAGMKYAVLTAKHHDGFCLFDSALTEYKSTNTLCKRDLVKEYVEAFREQGIKVGLYYSLLDWYHPDYEHFNDRIHPMRQHESFKDKKHDVKKYIEYFHGQVKELCSNYGKIDVLWFDFSYDDKMGEYWEATKLINMVRELQPDVLIDNRLEVSGEGFGSLATDSPTVYSGDFVSPEQIIPPNGITKANGEPLCWEACITMNNNWGYNSKDKNFKPADVIIKKLVECVSKGGNMLLNVGPDANGNIPCESIKILEDIGHFMSRNKESIYGCTNAFIDKPENGRITKKGKKLYYHIMENSIGSIPLYGIKKEDVSKIRLLEDNSEIFISNNWMVSNYPDVVFVDVTSTVTLPNPIDTVIEVTLK